MSVAQKARDVRSWHLSAPQLEQAQKLAQRYQDTNYKECE